MQNAAKQQQIVEQQNGQWDLNGPLLCSHIDQLQHCIAPLHCIALTHRMICTNINIAFAHHQKLV